MATEQVTVFEDLATLTEVDEEEVTLEVTEQVAVLSEQVIGIQGPPGLTDAHYEHIQSTPSADWTIEHNLHKKPSVTVVDSGGTEWKAEVEHVSSDLCVARFAYPFAGSAYLN